MGRGFESHRGHDLECQMVNNEAIWLFLLWLLWLPPCGANANITAHPIKGGDGVVKDHSKASGLDLR